MPQQRMFVKQFVTNGSNVERVIDNPQPVLVTQTIIQIFHIAINR
jgi:hypothetical protein